MTLAHGTFLARCRFATSGARSWALSALPAKAASAAMAAAVSLCIGLSGCASNQSQPVAGATRAGTTPSSVSPLQSNLRADTAFLSAVEASEAAEYIRLGRESMHDAAWFEAAEFLDSALSHLALLDASGTLSPAQQIAAGDWSDSVRTWLVEATAQSNRLGGAEDLSDYLDQEIEEVSLASLEDLEALLPRLPDRDFGLPLPSPLPHSVLQAMRVFTGSGRGYFEKWLQRKGRYEAMIHARLDERGMPRDLVYLAMVESGFNPKAWSHASASGLWQFISPTGRRYGLTDDWWEDARRDPVRATDAALDYLEDLHGLFGEWHQAMAAYNCGEGRIRRQARAEPGLTYWEMTLPKETRYYVPKILAAMIIGRNPAVFGFNTASTQHEPLRYDTATVTRTLPIKGIAEAVGVSEDSIKTFNPALRRWSTPPGRASYTLYLPPGTRDLFFTNLEGIATAPAQSLATHRVRRGQTLSRIARRYGVSMADLRSANSLRSNKVRIGQVLTIPLADLSASAGYSSASSSEPRVARTMGGNQRHIVRSGETLSGIAARYRVPVSTLRITNAMRPGSVLKAGKVLSIPGSGRDEVMLAANESYYRVRSGDNLWAISSRFGHTVNDLKRLNDGLSESLTPGQRIRVR
jgi:membrane-bound lytic murein transglycosylase D